MRGTAIPGDVVSPEKEVRRRAPIIEKVSKGARATQPPSLYISVTTPLDVLAIPDSSRSEEHTIFYKVPQVHHCETIFEPLDPCPDTEEALSTMKVNYGGRKQKT